MQAAALNTVLAYEREAVERLRRMSLLSADLDIKTQRRNHGGSPYATVSDEWYDDAPPQAA